MAGEDKNSSRHFFCQKNGEGRRKSSRHAFVPTKALHSKPKVFFTSSPNSREDLPVKSLHYIPLVKTFRLRSTCEVFSLRE